MKHSMLAGAVAAVSLALAVPAIAQAPSATPKRGGTLTFAISAEAPTYDCHAGNTYAVVHAVAPFYSTLLKFDLSKYPAVEGDVAESWEISPDQKTFTFRLRDNVVFHDGTRLTSRDVRATYERLRNPPPGVVSVRRASYEDISEILTPDERTVVFKLSEANPSVFQNFASPWDCIYSAAKLAEDPLFPQKTIMGTGPFKFVEHVRGSHFAGVRHEQYHVRGQPYLDGFRGVIFSQGSAMLNALQGGQVLAEFRSLSPAERDRIVGTLGQRIRIEEESWVLKLTVAFNAEKAPFNDPRVRRALSMAIDRWGGSQGLSRIATLRAVGGVMRPGSPFATPEAELAKLPGFGRDIRAAREEARRLLREAGVPNLSFVLTNRTLAQPYTPGGVFLVDQWRQIGVTVEHRQLETAAYNAAQANGTFDVILDFSNEFMDEPNNGLTKYISSDRSPNNPARAVDRDLDRLYDQQRRETDPAKRNAIIQEFERLAMERAYTVPLLWWHRIVATHQHLRGWQMSPSHLLGQSLAGVWLDQ